MSTRAARANEVEDCLASAVLHGPHDRITMIVKPSAAKRAANDPHFGIAIGGLERSFFGLAVARHNSCACGYQMNVLVVRSVLVLSCGHGVMSSIQRILGLERT